MRFPAATLWASRTMIVIVSSTNVFATWTVTSISGSKDFNTDEDTDGNCNFVCITVGTNACADVLFFPSQKKINQVIEDAWCLYLAVSNLFSVVALFGMNLALPRCLPRANTLSACPTPELIRIFYHQDLHLDGGASAIALWLPPTFMATYPWLVVSAGLTMFAGAACLPPVVYGWSTETRKKGTRMPSIILSLCILVLKQTILCDKYESMNSDVFLSNVCVWFLVLNDMLIIILSSVI